MSGLPLTIDDGNPLITYEPAGAWTQRNSSTDATVAKNFHGETWMVTQTSGATISFSFEGIAFVVYGTKSPQNGNYTVDVDGIVGNVLWTGQNTSIQYSVPIYISRPLTPTAHTITILNKNNRSLSIDYITWTVVDDSNKSGTLSQLDDRDPSFNYYGGPWSNSPSQVGNFSDNTGHSTLTLGSAFNLTFSGKYLTIALLHIAHSMEGDAVYLYGSVGPNNGAYSVQLDAQLAETFVATEPTYVTQTLLYYANNLGPGNHTLHVINEEDSLFEVDYAEVLKLPNLLSNVTSTGSSSSNPTEMTGVSGSKQDGSSLSNGAIAGISISVVVVILLVLIVGFCVYSTRLKRRWIREREASAVTYSPKNAYTTLDPADINAISPFRDSKSSVGSPISPAHKFGAREYSRHTNISPLVRESQHPGNFDEGYGP